MILVDTSVWIDHFRCADRLLQDMLISGEVLTHPFIIGELACGNLSRREEVLDLLCALPSVTVATHDEVMHMIAAKELYGKGTGLIDMHLIASALLDHVGIWTKDKSLNAVLKMLE